jgi:hypothetical protein
VSPRQASAPRQRGELRRVLVVALLLILVLPALEGIAGTVSVPNVFTDGTTALAAEVNANFDALVVESNTQDGRIADDEAELSGLGSCTGGSQRLYYDGSTLRCYSTTTKYLTLPAVAFTPQTGELSTGSSGTARIFLGTVMFAPVNLPGGASVTRMSCGGNDASSNAYLRFTLRRNHAQVANVDMAIAETTTPEFGFKYPFDTTIISPTIDNSLYNYYIRGSVEGTFFAGFTVGFCKIDYLEPVQW